MSHSTTSFGSIFNKPKEILLVEDHPMTSKGYELILNNASQNRMLPELNFKKANSLESAYHVLMGKIINKETFDVIFLDIRMCSSEKLKLYSGEDLGKLIRDEAPKTKLIVMTSITSNYRLHSILTSINPEGFLVKTEISELTLSEALEHVLKNKPYFSPQIVKLIKNQYFSPIKLNTEQKEFLYLLSKGVSTKNIVNHIPWSLSKLEKQKRMLKEKFNVEEKSVLALVHKAKKFGFI